MNATLAHEWISSLAAWSAETSLAVLLPALVVLCISHLRLIPARWCALLAALLLVRLLLPEVVPVSWRVAFDPRAEVSWVSEVPSAASSDRSDVSDSSDFVPAGASLSAKAALPFAWALGAAGVLTWLGASAFQIRRLTRTALPADSTLVSLLEDCARTEGLRRSPRLALIEGLPSVAVHGFFRPLLLLPADIAARHTTAELRGIFLHELQHLKRADCAWTWLGLVACAVHWFNPLAWMLFRRFCADREIACDEAALHHMHHEARRSYGEALIKTAELHIAPALLPSFSSNPTELKHRMKLIMKPSSRSLLVQFVSAAISIGIASVAFTTARADGEKKKSAEGDGAKEEVRKAGREGDGERKKEGARDGDSARKEGARDGEGEGAKRGARDGEGERKGPRDGEMKKSGARDGEGAKRGARDGEGEGRKSAEAEGGGRMREGERGERPASKSSAPAGGRQMIIQVDAEGSVVNSQGDVIDIKMVRGRMKQIADENPGQSVILRADARTEIGKVRAVLDALKDVGLKDVTLETK